MVVVHRPASRHPRASRLLVLATPLVLTAALGCQAKAQLEECQTRLAAADAEKARLEQDLQDIRGDYKELVRGWGIAQSPDAETTSEQYLADVQQRIDVMKNVVANQVPALVQEQLQKELGALADTLETQFGEIDTRHAQLRMQLDQVHGALGVANQRLENLQQAGSDIQTELVAQRVDEDKLEQEMEALSIRLEEFDEKHFLCKECPEYLDIKRKRQDEILAFHNEVRSTLRRVPISVMRVAADAGTEAESAAEVVPSESSDDAGTPD